MPDWNVPNYKDVSTKNKQLGVMDKCQRLICSIQSLHYIKKNFDIIIFDKFDTLMQTFSGDCKTHNRKLGTKLGDIQESDTIREQNATLRIMKSLNHQRNPNKRLFLEYNDFDVWIQDILDDLKKGKKHYVFTPAKSGEKGVDAIAAVIAKHMGWKDNTQILSYFGEKEKEKKALSYIEKLCTNEENKKVALWNNGEQYERSDCTVFERLRQDLQLEISANKNVKNWETFKLFMEMLDIKLTPKDKEWSMRAAAQTMDELMEDCELLLDWNRIPDVSDQLLCCINE
ncbi:hypothetical protein DFS34DRAFT_591023 [Phlyctochytrium arcticum]|nr:hypothetical protein DFS34DRAFT_591023 [Phlyctochytrium arcticum]